MRPVVFNADGFCCRVVISPATFVHFFQSQFESLSLFLLQHLLVFGLCASNNFVYGNHSRIVGTLQNKVFHVLLMLVVQGYAGNEKSWRYGLLRAPAVLLCRSVRVFGLNLKHARGVFEF